MEGTPWPTQLSLLSSSTEHVLVQLNQRWFNAINHSMACSGSWLAECMLPAVQCMALLLATCLNGRHACMLC